VAIVVIVVVTRTRTMEEEEEEKEDSSGDNARLLAELTALYHQGWCNASGILLHPHHGRGGGR
jgi:hypothetical protein